MDDDSPPPTQFRSESMIINHGSAPYAGAYFPRSRNLTVSGGTFISNNYNEPAMPPDFRRIPLGDIDLRNEICFHKESGVIDYQHSRGSVRRVYSAKIDGRKSNMTVALYEGDNAKKEWRDTITKYSRLRHPNFVQIFATASSSGIHAIVVHDDLIPFNNFLQLYHDSPILTVHIYGCFEKGYNEANDYFKHMFGSYLDDNIATFWICRSTGRFCLDLMPGDIAAPLLYSHKWTPLFDHIPPLNDPNSEAIMIDSMELGEYHGLCSLHLGHNETFMVFTQGEIHLGAVVYFPSGSDRDDLDQIAFLPDAYPYICSWYVSQADGDTMEDGWTRYNSAEIFGTIINSMVDLNYHNGWLPQANHIFHQLQIKSNYEDYGIIIKLDFFLRILKPRKTPPNGYLFICPTEDLQTGPTSFQWPECPLHWSLDPSGAEYLSTDEAMYLGFPSIELETYVVRRCWDATVYAGLHKFHEGKGFDPDSQDVALHLGHLLYQLLHEREVPFAHVDKVSDVETEIESSYTANTEDEDGSTAQDVDCDVSDVENEREITTEDKGGDGSAPEDVDGKIPETERKGEGSSSATNEDQDRDKLTPQEECTSLDSVTDVESVPQSWSWKAVMFVKFALILALSFQSLYEYGQAALSQGNI